MRPQGRRAEEDDRRQSKEKVGEDEAAVETPKQTQMDEPPKQRQHDRDQNESSENLQHEEEASPAAGHKSQRPEEKEAEQ